jgi:hypothetical protein
VSRHLPDHDDFAHVPSPDEEYFPDDLLRVTSSGDESPLKREIDMLTF